MSKKLRLPVLQEAPAEPSAAPQNRPDLDLPELIESELDWDGVDCVLADLDDFTEIREMLGRPASGQPHAMSDIVVARDQLVAGELHGLQITYAFADELWIDTLLREPAGARLLRMAAPSRGN